ncbi:hypothetical protein BURMUCGD1_3901 [Burkholderia multivorans CGD1]|nr:hypothetical protein BURMUCGD1_3901 [Burkholderia multivorans CGD1]
MTVRLHEHARLREICSLNFHEKLARQFHGSKRSGRGAREWSDEPKWRAFSGGFGRGIHAREEPDGRD